MLFKDCLEIGVECGLSHANECILNVKFHSTSIFQYEKIQEELDELMEDANRVYEQSGFGENSDVKAILQWMNQKDGK